MQQNLRVLPWNVMLKEGSVENGGGVAQADIQGRSPSRAFGNKAIGILGSWQKPVWDVWLCWVGGRRPGWGFWGNLLWGGALPAAEAPQPLSLPSPLCGVLLIYRTSPTSARWKAGSSVGGEIWEGELILQWRSAAPAHGGRRGRSLKAFMIVFRRFLYRSLLVSSRCLCSAPALWEALINSSEQWPDSYLLISSLGWEE